MMPVSNNEFRAALSAYPAGVTIVTSTSADGESVGATVSAFMSLSLEPRLVLVSLTRGSRTAEAIASQRAFVVHFVNEATADLALRFAGPGANKFVGLRSRTTESGVPMLLDFDTRLDCSLYALHGGGDHIMFVGQVNHVDLPQHDKSHSVAWYNHQFCQLVALEKAIGA